MVANALRLSIHVIFSLNLSSLSVRSYFIYKAQKFSLNLICDSILFLLRNLAKKFNFMGWIVKRTIKKNLENQSGIYELLSAELLVFEFWNLVFSDEQF